jgi:hypothetical protein
VGETADTTAGSGVVFAATVFLPVRLSFTSDNLGSFNWPYANVPVARVHNKRFFQFITVFPQLDMRDPGKN